MLRFLTASLLLISCAEKLYAFDRTKSVSELETVTVELPDKKIRSYKLKRNSSYAVSAIITASEPDIARVELRLFDGKKQLRYLRSMFNDKEGSRQEIVFNSDGADRAEVIMAVREDAMPKSRAVFSEYRFVSCDNTVIQAWNKRGPTNCRARTTAQNEVILYPNRGRGSGFVYSLLEKPVPHSRMRFSADVSAQMPGVAFLQVSCAGNNIKTQNFRTAVNSAKKQRLQVEFNVGEFRWISLRLCCINGKKFRDREVVFSNIKITPIPEK